jgi:hypothetical protein
VESYPITIKVGFLSKSASYNNEVSEFNNEVSESDDKVEFLQMIV